MVSLFAILYFVPDFNIGSVHVFTPFLEPTKVTVNEVQYTIIADKDGILIYTGLVPTISNSQNLMAPQQGQNYPCLGLNIKIIEVGVDRYLLSITSRN